MLRQIFIIRNHHLPSFKHTDSQYKIDSAKKLEFERTRLFLTCNVFKRPNGTLLSYLGRGCYAALGVINYFPLYKPFHSIAVSMENVQISLVPSVKTFTAETFHDMNTVTLPSYCICKEVTLSYFPGTFTLLNRLTRGFSPESIES